MKRFFRSALLAGLVLLSPALRAEEANKEYLVKAAFMYNFVKFVEWPAELAIAKQSSINICILGDNPFDGATSVFKAGSTASLKLNVVEEKSLKEHTCHILFISSSEEPHLGEILGTLRTQPVLTVSDIPDFAGKGGVVGFTTQDNKVKLIVNTKAAAQANLRIDAQLLEIALSVIR